MASEFISSDVPMMTFNIGSDYGQALETVAPGVTPIMRESAQPGEDWVSTLQRLLPALAATWQQREILQIQMERAKAGLPPLDAQQYAAGVQVGVAPELQKMLIVGGIALLAVLWFASKKRAS